MSAPAAATSQAALRVLCLHGYVQNGTIFRQRTGSLRKALGSRVGSYHFVDAPHSAAGAFPETSSSAAVGDEGAERGEAQAPEELDVRGWWNSGENAAATATSEGWVRPSQSKRAVGVDASLSLLVETLRKDGPFDGILAFSQGAAMGALLLAHVHESGIAATLHLPRFAILVAGFLPYDEDLQRIMAVGLPLCTAQTAVLCVSGTEDKLVPPERVGELMNSFKTEGSRLQLFSHSGGHGIPSNAAFRNTVKAFIDAQT